MEDLINEFIAETREMLEALGGEIVAWESAPDDRGRLDEIFRFVHTVKGNCGFFDLPRLEALSHAAEDVLAEVRAGKRVADPHLVSAVLAVIDRIGELVQALETGESVSSADDEQLIEALRETTVAAERDGAAGAGTAADARKTIRSIRLSVDLLDRMMSGVSDLVLARNELARRLRETNASADVDASFERVSACIAEMRDAITRTRMQRIDNLFVSLPRMVRDLSNELGKQVTLEVDGGDVELDREMIEMIRDPLTHIVRNAIDHGIESSADRVGKGKAAAGLLRVCARQSGNQILIEIADDGRGIDGERLLAKAIANEVVSAEQGKRLNAAQRIALIFEPGVSTASEVTAISGRGVGMDVVRANIERIGGVVDIESKPNQGVRLTLRVPLTLTIIPALTVSVAGRDFAIPRSAIEEIVRAQSQGVRLESLGGSKIANIRDRRLPLLMLADVLGTPTTEECEGRSLIVLKPAGGETYALGVDRVHDHEELVVKPASPAVMASGIYAGTTLADDGKPILLLDPSGVAASAGVVLDQNEIEKLASSGSEAEPAASGVPALLFQTLDGERRAIRLSIVERIEEVAPAAVRHSAGRMRVALGDQILPLAGVAARPEERIRVLRLSDGISEIAYGFAEVIDLATLSDDLQPASVQGEIAGVVLIGGEQVEVLDPYWLFAVHSGAAETDAARPVCALPGDDPWMTNILRPIVESAGYQVITAEEAAGRKVDVAITASDVAGLAVTAAQVVRVRSQPDPANDADDSIYRYDRAGLLGALSQRPPRRRKSR